jgi:Predicted transcriptional regulator
MESDPVRARLLGLADERGVSLAALSRMIGKNASYLQQFVRKGSPRKLEENDRGKLARFFGVDQGELGYERENSFASSAVPGADWKFVPRLVLGASAGSGTAGDGEEAIGAIGFSDRWLRQMGLQAAMLSAITVRGDSMEPRLRDGDEILVDRTPSPVRDGIHVVRLEDHLLVKRLDVSRPGFITLISENEAYPPAGYPAEDVQVVGRVVWKGGRI